MPHFSLLYECQSSPSVINRQMKLNKPTHTFVIVINSDTSKAFIWILLEENAEMLEHIHTRMGKIPSAEWHIYINWNSDTQNGTRRLHSHSGRRAIRTYYQIERMLGQRKFRPLADTGTRCLLQLSIKTENVIFDTTLLNDTSIERCARCVFTNVRKIRTNKHIRLRSPVY